MRDTMYAEQLGLLRSAIEEGYTAALAYGHRADLQSGPDAEETRRELDRAARQITLLWVRGMAILPERSMDALTNVMEAIVSAAGMDTPAEQRPTGAVLGSKMAKLVSAARQDLGSTELSAESRALLQPVSTRFAGLLDDRTIRRQ